MFYLGGYTSLPPTMMIVRLPSLSVFLFLCLLLSTACHSDDPIERLSSRFRSGYQEHFVTDTQSRLHFSSLPARLDSIGEFQQLLVAVDTHYLSQNGKDQRQELQTALNREWKRWQPYRMDPSRYNLAGLLKKTLANSTNDPAKERLTGMASIMEQADDYYRAARENLAVEDFSLYRLAAQKQYLGLEFLYDELPDSLATFDLPEADRQVFLGKVKQTALALKDYMGFCESAYLNYRDSTYYNSLERPEPRTATLQ